MAKRRTSRLPNGYGSIKKLSGKRRNPYAVLVTVGWKEINGEKVQIQKPIGYARTRESALALLNDFHKQPFNADSNPTFSEIYEKLDFSEKSKALQRAMEYAYRRSALLHKQKIREIKSDELQVVADTMTELSRSAQTFVRVLWAAIYKYAQSKDIVSRDYSKFVTFKSTAIPKVNHVFTEAQVRKMCDDLKILCLTGMRISEYLSVKTESIYDGAIHCVGTKTENSVRDIPIHTSIAEIVNQRLTGAYLCGGDSRVPYRRFVEEIFNKDMERLGLVDHTCHDTRRTFATMCSRANMNPVIVKRLMGHSISDLTENVYIKKTIKDLAKELKKLKI